MGTLPPAEPRARSIPEWMAALAVGMALLTVLAAVSAWTARAGFGHPASRPFVRPAQVLYLWRIQAARLSLVGEPQPPQGAVVEGRRVVVVIGAGDAGGGETGDTGAGNTGGVATGAVDPAAAAAVAAEVDRFLPAVEALLASPGAVPPEVLPTRPRQGPLAVVRLHARMEGLARMFGQAAGPVPLGAYHQGVIHLAVPSGTTPGGPLVHELGHWVLDLYAQGNYPNWFSEGVAQYVDQVLTGFSWDFPGATRRPHSLRELEFEFDGLEDRTAAYRDALTLVHCITAAGGDLPTLTAELGRGVPFYRALADVTGLSRGDLAACLAAGEH